MNYKLSILIFISVLFSCRNKTKTATVDKHYDGTSVQSRNTTQDDKNTLLLDTIKYDQVAINNLPLQIDTVIAIKLFSKPLTKNIFALGTCYHFGDTNLWDFNGNRYYVYKDSLYFHELYFDNSYKKQSFAIKLPKLTVTAHTQISDFRKVYPASFYSSKRSQSNTINFWIDGQLQCQFQFTYKDGKLWRFAIHM